MQTLEDRLNRKYSDFDLDDNTFDRTTEVHDWRNHVPDNIIQNWKVLNDDEKFLIALTAQVGADEEEWN